VHIAFGTMALVVAPGAMATVKGGRWHRRWGKIYFWAMAGVAATAFVMCYLRSGVFLFLVGIFSFYLALTGYTVLARKKATDRPAITDWIAAGAMVAAGVAFLVTGAMGMNRSDYAWVRNFVFGGIGLLFGAADLVNLIRWRGWRNPRGWMYYHMTRFLGAYIATVTAFSVVNLLFLPFLVRWLLPTGVGLVGILMWRRYYRRKFKENKAVPELARA
jgi:uncharacterized membrane protein